MPRLNEPQIRMLEAVCTKGCITCSGRSGGRTARILEHMGYVTVEYYVVWVRRQRRYSVDTVPRCRWKLRPTSAGYESLLANSCEFRSARISLLAALPDIYSRASFIAANFPRTGNMEPGIEPSV
jgi:hypothetical protein